MFDWTVNLGNLIQIITVIAGSVWIFQSMKADIRVVRHDITYLKEAQRLLSEAFSQLGTILTQVAVQDTRLNMVEKYIDDLRHGQGYIRTNKEKK